MKPQLTIEAFADWCSKQPADRGYNYHCAEACACGQYAASLGMKEYAWIDGYWGETSFWRSANNHARIEPHTFGSLSLRLRQSSSRSGS